MKKVIDRLNSIVATDPLRQVFFKVTLAVALVCICAVILSAGRQVGEPFQSIIWKLQDTTLVGNFRPLVLGYPQIVKDSTGTALSFNGVNEGLIIPAIPFEGWPHFTIEVLFKPAGDGPAAPRFIHFQDNQANRGTVEVRVTAAGNWYLDTFLKNGKTDQGLTLIDSSKQHPADTWYWAALVYNGNKMTSYVNAMKELEGEVNFVPMAKGQISLGVRLNKMNWFKGLIREVRFHPEALDRSALQKYADD